MSIVNLLATHTFDYIVLRVNFGLTSCEDLATALIKDDYIVCTFTSFLTDGLILLMKLVPRDRFLLSAPKDTKHKP